MKKFFAGLILILLGFNSEVFSQSSLSKCKGNDSSQWSKCFGTERVEDKISGVVKKAKYEGEYKSGKFHGQGTFIYPNGSVEDGNWNYGRLDK